MTAVLVTIIILLLIAVYLAVFRFGLHNLLIRQSGDRTGSIIWEDMGPTPLGEKKYTPQGLTWVGGRLVFANTWKNTRSRVYEIDPESMALLRHFDMPEEAVHTSGLTHDGIHLWAVDYISNRAYCIDLEASLANGRVALVGSFNTTLKGTSACCMVPWQGLKCLAISDFMRSRQTIFVRPEQALKTGTAENSIVFAYTNEGFSQGLAYWDGYLYESENKIGINTINKLDLDRLREAPHARKATVVQYPAPSKMVEDLVWDGNYVWTSDESVFRFFKGKFDPVDK